MAQRVVLHIGTMKSGTSYLQGQLHSQRARLAELGVLVPGIFQSEQIEALTQGRNRRGDRSTWTAMVAEIRADPSDVVLSHELLGETLMPGRCATCSPDLGSATVDVVITVRDLNRTLVSMWQETIQNGRTWTWDDYYESVRASAPYAPDGPVDRDSAGGRFWKQQDFLRMIEVWAERLGPERISVIPLPPPGADKSLLPQRFVDATGHPARPDPACAAFEPVARARVRARGARAQRAARRGGSPVAGRHAGPQGAAGQEGARVARLGGAPARSRPAAVGPRAIRGDGQRTQGS